MEISVDVTGLEAAAAGSAHDAAWAKFAALGLPGFGLRTRSSARPRSG
jgi:hypothetical protein